jgi:hypothetical protein
MQVIKINAYAYMYSDAQLKRLRLIQQQKPALQINPRSDKSMAK